MESLILLESLLANNNLSKSEVRVVYFCYDGEHSAKEIADYLSWQAPNVARLLLTMYNKGFLTRRRLDDNRTYLYSTNVSSDLLNIE